MTSPQIHSAATSGHITPPDLGQTITAAMGIGEYGLSAGVGGSLEPYDLNTTSLEANLSTNKTGLQPLYVLDSTPDAYSAELNAVLEDVTLFGNQTYQFWVQDIVLYYAQSHSLYLVSNIWDFSTPLLPPHAIVANGTNGSFRGLPFFYYSVSRLPNIAYPFNVTLFLNSTMIAGNDSVDFSAVLSAGGGTPVSYPFDFVEFNSTAPGIAPGTKPAVFDANGFTYTPTGHPYDFEFVLGGPGGGSQANFYAAGATMSLDYWNGTTRSYVAVPSALSYGSNSGESASGVNIEWTNATSGPHAIVSGGLSILTGLWNASGPPGVATIQTNVQPTDAFLFLNESANSFTGDAPVRAPTMLNSNVSVAPGTYTTSATLSYYSSTTEPIRVVAGQSVPFDPTLALDPASEVTTPIWVWNDSQFPALSSGGDGTNATPYLIRDGQVTPMASRFGEMNDFGFPVFSGVFFVGTHVSAELLQPGPFETDVPASSIYPPTNDLSYVFYDSTNVSVANASNISGWFSNSLYWNDSTPSAPNGPVLQTPYYTYATFNMVFWNSSHNLVANDTFNTESDGIYLAGGYNNTIWGSTFRWSPMSGPLAPNLWPRARAIGIQDAENGDLVYNNAVYTQTTAVNPGYNMYTGAPANYSDRWNRTYTTDTSLTYFAPGFNIPLSGSIVNGAYQGGNFWWNYGLPGNLMVTPPLYTDYGKISPGDYHPLTETFGLTFLEHGYNLSGNLGGSAVQQWRQLVPAVYHHHVLSRHRTGERLRLRVHGRPTRQLDLYPGLRHGHHFRDHRLSGGPAQFHPRQRHPRGNCSARRCDGVCQWGPDLGQCDERHVQREPRGWGVHAQRRGRRLHHVGRPHKRDDRCEQHDSRGNLLGPGQRDAGGNDRTRDRGSGDRRPARLQHQLLRSVQPHAAVGPPHLLPVGLRIQLTFRRGQRHSLPNDLSQPHPHPERPPWLGAYFARPRAPRDRRRDCSRDPCGRPDPHAAGPTATRVPAGPGPPRHRGDEPCELPAGIGWAVGWASESLRPRMGGGPRLGSERIARRA